MQTQGQARPQGINREREREGEEETTHVNEEGLGLESNDNLSKDAYAQ